MRNIITFAPLLLLLLLGHGLAIAAQPPFQQTFESCGVRAWSIYDTFKDAMAGVPLDTEKAKSCVNDYPCEKNADLLYADLSKKGAQSTYLEILGYLSTCAKQVSDRYGTATLTAVEATYKDCAESTAARLVVLVAIQNNTPITAVQARMGASYYPLITALYRTARESNLTKAAAMSDEAMSSCIERVEAAGRSLATGVAAADSEWVPVGAHNHTLYIKKDGCELDHGEPRTITCLDEFHMPDKTIYHYFISTTLEMCIRGNGSLLISHLDGTQVSKSDVVVGGNSDGDTLFAFICTIAFKAAAP